MDCKKIRLLFYDCDGVLTDNRVLVSETGEEFATFHRGDGYAIQMLKSLGIRQVIVSTETNPIVKYRARKLDIEVLYSVKNKCLTVQRFCEENGYNLDETMFIGNDLNDIDAMQVAGVSGCPSDAEPEVRKICNWVSKEKGGFGVIRDLYRSIFTYYKE